MPDITDQEMAILEKHGVVAPSNAKKAGAFAMGVAEAFNPLSIPQSAETLGRTIYKSVVPEKAEIVESPTGILVPRPVKSFSELAEESKKEAFFPEASVRKGVELIAGKSFAESLPKDYEIAGTMIGALSGLGYGGFKALKGSKLKQAERATKEVVRDIKFMTGEGEGPVLNAMIDRPQEVSALVQSGKLSTDALALKIRDSLITKQDTLGKAVGKYRNAALSNLKKSIDSRPAIDAVWENANATINDIPYLEAKDRKILDTLGKMLAPNNKKMTISPKDALRIVDWIDNQTNYEAKLSGAISSNGATAINNVRKVLKDQIRNSSGSAKDWAESDDLYSKFKENADDLIDKFSGDNRASLANSLLNNSKDPLRDRLSDALNLGAKNKATADAFFNELANIKAAQGLKAVDVTKKDPILDQANRILTKWTQRGREVGEAAGAAVGGGMGAVAGMPAGGFGIGGAGITGAYVGGKAGKYIGGLAGEAIGRNAASPFALLEKASKAKILGEEARQLAGDLGFLAKHFGIERANRFVASLGGLPAVNALGAWIRSQGAPLSQTLQSIQSTGGAR